MTYYKPTRFSFCLSTYKLSMYYKPTSLFRADVREIAHGFIIHTIGTSVTSYCACTELRGSNLKDGIVYSYCVLQSM